MSLSEQITDEIKKAMKAHDKVTLSTVRMIKAALMNAKIKLGHELTAQDELDVLTSEVKQRQESISEFSKAGREDLVQKTQAELEIVQKYMPKPLTDSELEQTVIKVIASTKAESKADFGKVMKALMPEIKGRADGKKASQLVAKQLNQKN